MLQRKAHLPRNQHNNPNTSSRPFLRFASPIDRRVNSSQINLPLRQALDSGEMEIDYDELDKQLALAMKYQHTVHLDMTHVLTQDKPAKLLLMEYRMTSGEVRTKHLKPLEPQKMRMLKSDEDIRNLMRGEIGRGAKDGRMEQSDSGIPPITVTNNTLHPHFAPTPHPNPFCDLLRSSQGLPQV